MASGTLGQASLAAATNTTVYTVAATPTTSMTNTTGYPIAVNLAVSAAGTPVAGEYLEFQTVIAPNSVLERGGLVATAAKLVVAFATQAGINVNVYGFEG